MAGLHQQHGYVVKKIWNIQVKAVNRHLNNHKNGREKKIYARKIYTQQKPHIYVIWNIIIKYTKHTTHQRV